MARVLETDRLILRCPTIDEIDRFHHLANNEMITRMLNGVDYPVSKEDMTKALERINEHESRGTNTYWCMYRKDTGEMIGAMMFFDFSKEHKHAELAYWCGVDYWGNGYTSEAARTVVDHGFRELELERIYGMAFTHNTASANVLEGVGMRFEGTFRHEYVKKGEYVDLHHYAILKSEWEELRNKTRNIHLETDRLIIRTFERTDIDALMNAFNHKQIADITTHMTYPYTRQNAKDFLKKARDHWYAETGYYLAIVLKQSGELIGDIHIARIRKKHGRCELGYALNPKYWNMGYASEASKEMVRFAFENLGLRRIVGETMTINKPCRRVLEKLGFVLEGISRQEFGKGDEYFDFARYSLLRPDWEKQGE